MRQTNVKTHADTKLMSLYELRVFAHVPLPGPQYGNVSTPLKQEKGKEEIKHI